MPKANLTSSLVSGFIARLRELKSQLQEGKTLCTMQALWSSGYNKVHEIELHIVEWFVKVPVAVKKRHSKSCFEQTAAGDSKTDS
jgi:hypothetical protein